MDPNVAALGGFDVAALSVEDLRARGIETGGIVTTEVGANPVWMRHSEFLADVAPRFDVIDRAYARRLTAAHVRDVTAPAIAVAETAEEAEALRAHPLRGLRLQRSFPCLGVLRIIDPNAGRMLEAECDVCGETVGVARVPAEPEDGEDEDRPRRRRRAPKKEGDEGWPF